MNGIEFPLKIACFFGESFVFFTKKDTADFPRCLAFLKIIQQLPQ